MAMDLPGTGIAVADRTPESALVGRGIDPIQLVGVAAPVALPRSDVAIPGARGTIRDHSMPDARVAHRRLARRVLHWGVVLIAVVLLVRFARLGWPEVRASLSLLTVDQLPYVALATGVEALWLVAMSQVYRSALMAFGGAVGRGAVLRISMIAFTLSRIAPGGGAAGGVVAARELILLGNPAVTTVVAMLVSWWLTMTGLSAVLVVGIATSTVRGTLPAGYLAAPAAALALFLLGGLTIVLAARMPGLQRRMARLIVGAVDRMGPVMAGTASSSPTAVVAGLRPHLLLSVFIWGLAVWTLDATALWLALAAFGWTTDIGVLLLAYGVANLISALPELTPGWIGVIEASVAVTLSTFGVPPATAVVSVLVYRLVSYWLPTAAGLPVAIHFLRHPTRSPAIDRYAEEPQQ